MKIEVSREALARELGLARRLGERKALIPVYSYAKLTAVEGEVRLQSTDGEASLETGCAATTLEPGETLVPTKTLHELVRMSSADQVTLASAAGDRLTVTVGGFKSKLSALSLESFPTLHAWPETLVQLPTKMLKSAITRTIFVVEAASLKTGNYYQHGALLRVDEKKLSFVATDGNQIAHVSMPHTAPLASKALLPRKGMNDLLTLLELDDAPEEIGYARDEGRAFFRVGLRQFVTRLIDAEFPKYERFVKPPVKHGVEANRAAWLAALRRVMVVSTERSIKVTLAIEDSTMTCSMNSADVGEAVEEVPVTADATWSAAFDSKHLSHYLSVAGADTVRFSQEGPKSGLLLQTQEDEIESIHALMPMAV